MTTVHPNLENPLNAKFGMPAERAATKVKDELPELVRNFIMESPFIVIATSNSEGLCDASPKGGKPGFVKILDDQHLIIPDIAGNKLFQSYLNIIDNPHIGIVFFIPGCADVARVNGKVSFLEADEVKKLELEADVFNPDDRTMVIQGLLVEVEEAYGHCPRSLNFGEVWDVDQIQRNGDIQRIVNPGTRLENREGAAKE